MEQLKLENQLCFPVYALSRHMMALYRPYLLKLDLTYPQYLVMMVLWEHEMVTVKQLGELLWLDSGTLTPLLKRMEAHGHLNRSRSEKDERVVEISITKKGLKLKQQAAGIPENVLAVLETEEQQLIKLRNQLKQILSITSLKM
jgi:DNA-binding MarR family transcriptional regulator